MTVDHRFLSSSEVHEPKHISLATTANAGEVVTPSSSTNGQSVLRRLAVTDLSGGSDLVDSTALINDDRINYQGWEMIEDGLVATPAITVGTTAVALSIDDEGVEANRNQSYLPLAIRGTGSLWEVGTSRITPVEEGDTYNYRVNLTITGTASTPTTLTLLVDTGTGASPTEVELEQVHDITKAAPYSTSFSSTVAVSSTFKANGGRLFFKTDQGTVTIGARSLVITRTGSGLNGGA